MLVLSTSSPAREEDGSETCKVGPALGNPKREAGSGLRKGAACASAPPRFLDTATVSTVPRLERDIGLAGDLGH
jgi:hypothetical protein